MEFLTAIFFFCFGAVLASFFNLCVFRIEKKEPVREIFTGRSFCENCRKNLNWYELIPIFSFLFLKGKCSSCGVKIDSFNILSELFLGLLFSLFWIFNFPILLFFILVILYFFAVYDFYYKSIPKNITDVILLISFIYWFVQLLLNYDIEHFYPIFLLLLFSFFLFVFSRKKTLFGVGDILVLLILAFLLENNIFFNVFLLSFAIGGLFSLGLVIKDKKYFKKYIPFLPFIFFGFVFASFLSYFDISLFDYILTMW